MFLTHEEKLNWKALFVGAIFALVLIFAGVFWFDIPMYNFLHRFDWGVWNVFGALFGAKVWLVVSFLVVVVFYLRKAIKTKSHISICGWWNIKDCDWAYASNIL